jgi:hypothetical protein
MLQDQESARLEEARTAETPWRKWGPYLSERQWGTVRDDYSQDGNAWDYFTHDQARSREYHWGEDGLAGISQFLAVRIFLKADTMRKRDVLMLDRSSLLRLVVSLRVAPLLQRF